VSVKSIALALLVPAALLAQTVTPHIGYVYPAGGRQGATIQVTVGGQFLDGATQVLISGSGIQARIVNFEKPLTQGQFNRMRDELQELTDKKKNTPAKYTAEDDQKAADLRKKMSTLIRRPVAPAIVERVTLQVTLAQDAALGEHEIRLGTATGLTNPLIFCVNQLSEFTRRPARPVDEQVLARAARFRVPEEPEPTIKLTLPAIVNGQIAAGTVDKFPFQAKKGQRLVVAASARELIPYISDAVPGWFQATVGVYDSKGKELSYADHYTFHPDPVLYFEIAEDGEYTLAVKDSIYRGREDFVYRIAIGELPFITGVFPLGTKAGSRNTTVELKGWNLPVAKLKLKAGQTPDVKSAIRKVAFATDDLPEAMAKASNGQMKSAQRLKLPVVVNGRIEKPGDWDIFRFEGRAGEEIVAEVLARRLDSPLDSILKLTDASGKQLAVNDDREDKGSGLLTHHADSFLQFKLPANGAYYLHLGDTQQKGGPLYAYRLRISHPRPAYELRVTPASISARAGATVPITVYALRHDGYQEEIALRLKDAPGGFLLSGASVPAGEDKVRLTLTVPGGRTEKPVKLHLEGRAMVAGKEVRKAAIPAEDMMQAFYYHHLVASSDWMVRILGNQRGSNAWKAVEKRVQVPAGGTAPVQVFVPAGRFSESVQLALNEPPEGLTIENVNQMRDGFAITLHADGGKLKPGVKGNLIVEAYQERSTPGTLNKRRQGMGILPAIPFEVTAPHQ
jgi:hypothetical protein